MIISMIYNQKQVKVLKQVLQESSKQRIKYVTLITDLKSIF